MRNLYVVAADVFVQQNGSWPQIRMQGRERQRAARLRQCMDRSARPVRATQHSWICPTMQGLLGNPDLAKPEKARVDYITTPFDDKPTTTHQWPRQSWFLESGDVHSHGNLIIFTDGSVSDLKTVIKSSHP